MISIFSNLFKRKKVRGKITFLTQLNTNLFCSDPGYFCDLKTKYKGTEHEGDINYISFGLVNDGFVDLKSGSENYNITIKLPSNFRWIDYKIKNKSDAFAFSITTINNLLIINFDIFRSRQFTQIVALVESISNEVSPDDILKKIKVNHEIPDFKKIKTKKILTEAEIKKIKKKALWAIGEEVAKLLIPFLMVGALLYFYTAIADFQYYSIKNGEKKIFTASAETDNKVFVRDIKSQKGDKISIEEFQSKYTPFIPKQTWRRKISPHMDKLYAILALLAAAFIFDYISKKRKKRIYEILKA